jgi:LysM repeat protein
MTELKFGDYSRYQGDAPDYSIVDGVILNCTPQNTSFRAQLSKAVAEGKLIGYYSWPFAFGGTGAADGAGCAAALAGLPAGPVFWDIESGSYGGADPVSEGLAFARAIQAAGRGAGDYLQYSLIGAYDWSSHVAAGIFLWFAEYTTAPDTTYGAWPFATGWQYADKLDNGSGGDESIFYTDAAGWAALSTAPGAAPVAPAVMPQTAPPSFVPAAPAGVIANAATVEAGDTLSGIAAQVGVSLADLIAANPQITNPDSIYPGEPLNMPAGANLAALHGVPAAPEAPEAPEAAPSRPSQCVVEAGDTLSGIGAQFGVDWQAIASLNGLTDPFTIYPGQVLNLPA